MLYRTLHFIGLFVPFLFWISAAPAQDSARTPEFLIHSLAEAARNGDTEAFLSHLTAESRKAVDESLATQSALQRSRENFRRALTQKFGQAGSSATLDTEDFKAHLMRIEAFELLSTKQVGEGALELRIKTSLKLPRFGGKAVSHEDTFVARRQGGEWKLELSAGSSARLVAEKTALDRVAEAVRNGEFIDVQSALSELGRINLVPLEDSQRGLAVGTEKLRVKSQPTEAAQPSGHAGTAVTVHANGSAVRP